MLGDIVIPIMIIIPIRTAPLRLILLHLNSRVASRSEFHVSGKEYGMLAEGDIGTLTFQGTRYIDFTRTKLAQFQRE